ncbi:MAG: class I SAM-dependent methyltransferase [Phycisphaeraceae bacterium]|nr:MAG: class I SAM-dependent methyltransferase [Phycisphaeraceae bacterium]
MSKKPQRAKAAPPPQAEHPAPPPGSPSHAPLDRHDLYERCVQSPDDLVGMIAGMHGRRCTTLGEDLAGTAALSHRWVESDPKRRAIAIDLDEEALSRRPAHKRIQKLTRDIHRVNPASLPPCDAIFVGNFSIGYIHDRRTLVRYLKRSRSRLKRGGIFVCDTYGGASAFTTGHVKREHRLPDGRRVIYTWEQREADPITGIVTNAMHFQIDRDGDIDTIFADAFLYHWRLWSIPELADAMEEAGFAAFDVYDKVPSAIDGEGRVYMQPVDGPDLDESFIACVCARL